MHDASHCNQWFLKNMLCSFTAVIAAFAFKTKDAVAAMRGFCLEPSQFFPHVWSFTSVRSGLMHGICGILIRVSIASIDVIMSFASLLLMGSAVASLFAFFACQFT